MLPHVYQSNYLAFSDQWPFYNAALNQEFITIRLKPNPKPSPFLTKSKMLCYPSSYSYQRYLLSRTVLVVIVYLHASDSVIARP